MSRAVLALLLAAGCTPPVTAPSAPASTAGPTAVAAPGSTEPAAVSPEPPPDWHLAPASSAPFASSPACQTDDACGWARCHASGRCAFPCAADGDCQGGARCQPSAGNRSVNVCTMP